MDKTSRKIVLVLILVFMAGIGFVLQSINSVMAESIKDIKKEIKDKAHDLTGNLHQFILRLKCAITHRCTG
jgi:hypothetical protein